MRIRPEETKDYQKIFNLIEDAFKDEQYTDHQEQFLVERLRNSDSFIPALSLVAQVGDQIVGYILLTKIDIVDSNKAVATSLALAPVAVKKNYQRKGIGGELIRAAHAKAKELGYKSVVLLGHENYYPRFGYIQSTKFGISLPFDVPEENCMAIELTENGLKNVSGVVQYPKEFFG